MSIRIITDSASDIYQSEAKELNISVLPLTTIFSDGDYLDGITLSHMEFYNKLVETSEIPKTSQISPFQYEEEFKKYPNDDIIVITISKKLSGCYQSANIAAENYKNVKVVDSEQAAIGERIVVELALRLVEEGKTVDEIIEILDKKKKEICLIFLLDTLEFLKKGGRISSSSAFIGSLLNIKPVITLEDGVVKSLGKARGSKNANNMLRKLVTEAGGINKDDPYALAYSGLSDALLQKYIDDNTDLYEGDTKEIKHRTIGSTIGTHIGPNAIALAFFRK